MFTQEFDTFVCEGDSITCEVEGLTFTAYLERDTDSTPMELDFEGACFWTDDPDHGEENQEIIDQWCDDEWHYFGVVIAVEKDGITLDEHAASLWGIEGNFPNGNNSYFSEVANELLSEAHASALITLQDMRDKLAA